MPSESVRLTKGGEMDVIERLQSSLTNLNVLRASGLNIGFEIDAVEDAIEVISRIHALLDGKEWDSDTTSGIDDALTTYGLVIRSQDEFEEEA